METRSNYAIVGAVVVAITIALFAAVIWLSRYSGEDQQIFDIFFKSLPLRPLVVICFQQTIFDI